ncbi:MAG: PilZ domain-containing protein [Thermodesulfobacteriota bacterium]
MEGRERRINRRVPAEFKVSYIHDGDYLISRSKDISIDGMFIYTENPPAVGENSTLVFVINDREVSVAATVIWVNLGGPTIDHGMGVRFSDAPDDLRAEILKMVRKVAIIES